MWIIQANEKFCLSNHTRTVSQSWPVLNRLKGTVLVALKRLDWLLLLHSLSQLISLCQRQLKIAQAKLCQTTACDIIAKLKETHSVPNKPKGTKGLWLTSSGLYVSCWEDFLSCQASSVAQGKHDENKMSLVCGAFSVHRCCIGLQRMERRGPQSWKSSSRC